MENKMETCRIENLYNLNETIAKDLFEGAVYPLGASAENRRLYSGAGRFPGPCGI